MMGLETLKAISLEILVPLRLLNLQIMLIMDLETLRSQQIQVLVILKKLIMVLAILKNQLPHNLKFNTKNPFKLLIFLPMPSHNLSCNKISSPNRLEISSSQNKLIFSHNLITPILDLVISKTLMLTLVNSNLPKMTKHLVTLSQLKTNKTAIQLQLKIHSNLLSIHKRKLILL